MTYEQVRDLRINKLPSSMVTELTEKIKSSLKDAAKKLTGFKKRAFMAQVTIDYFPQTSKYLCCD
ncbi:MAG: hypothetical protein EWV60_19405 [Microcystis sp. Msp_OC_L_20101000_S702]|uniref:hypothetical protein n=1 Tax=Microcystis sp. Msp_OC_L_20101000_S702 TaxID=2486218 RepID=UPI0011931F24|nr:hypothetical protein [Microcystis sp. Msp_OC_L_20101000_S702]TRU05086.1 MAG: hypothetical protein EWV60_19405 [Microcystis sp. Msp_OC_L_20101000_S702]